MTSQVRPSLRATTIRASYFVLPQCPVFFDQNTETVTTKTISALQIADIMSQSYWKRCFALFFLAQIHGFVIHSSIRNLQKTQRSDHHLHVSSSSTDVETLTNNLAKLKKVISREYITFFDPMETQYYANDVTFDDPMTSLSGVQSYKNNVDMLASRTLLGKILFQDAGIVLHNISGGLVNDDGSIQDIVTRWTLKMTFKILPWCPTARFTGISVYKVVKDTTAAGVSIVKQQDYWDSINILPNSGGAYQTVDKGKAVNDFIGQISPGGFTAKEAAPELPYQLLRRGDGYEVRMYPSHTGLKLPYKRRDEGFGSLGAFTKGMSPLGPAIMDVQADDVSDKYMMWPLTYAKPGEKEAPIPKDAVEKAGEGQWRTMKVVTIPESVVAVREFTDASMEPVVRKADRELRALLDRDGLKASQNSEDLVRFAQYDAIFSMGRRRGEVWIELAEDGHPWN